MAHDGDHHAGSRDGRWRQNRFYPDEHPPPHFHARIAEHVAQVEIRTGRVLRGSLPPAKLGRVLSWAADHRIGLMNAWTAVEELRKPEKIDD